MADDTIAAISTATGRGGIGIIKISGELSIPIATAIFQPAGKRNGREAPTPNTDAQPIQLVPHYLHYGRIYDRHKGRILDEVLISVMPGPHSYTREDVVEINAHGGPLAMQAILELVIGTGARLAEPGEFTRRAFLNGRIDLTQAEAVMDTINAKTELSLHAAAAQMDGQLQTELESIRNAVLDLLTRLDASIDFPEDVEDIGDVNSLVSEIGDHVARPLKRLIKNYDEAHVLRDGLQVAVVGKPNVGKSSLLNQMVQNDRAIVTAVAGTTRDVVSETINLKGIPVTLSDTAGLQTSTDQVEIMGIQKTLEQVESCDLVLFMIEAQLDLVEADISIYHQVRHRPHIIVVNKIDLLDGKPIEGIVPASLGEGPMAAISALHGDGLEGLKDQILELIGGPKALEQAPAIIPNLRHKILLERALTAADEICNGLDQGIGAELLAVHAAETLQCLEEILGLTATADIIERIFDQFCIGK